MYFSIGSYNSTFYVFHYVKVYKVNTSCETVRYCLLFKGNTDFMHLNLSFAVLYILQNACKMFQHVILLPLRLTVTLLTPSGVALFICAPMSDIPGLPVQTLKLVLKHATVCLTIQNVNDLLPVLHELLRHRDDRVCGGHWECWPGTTMAHVC